MRLTHTLLALSGLCLISLSAQAQLFSDEEARRAILDLRARVNTLEARNAELSNRLEGMSKGQLEIYGQIDRVRAELSELRGGLEQTSQQTDVAQRQQKELFQSLEDQLNKAQEKLEQVGPQTVSIDGATISPVSPEEKKLFNEAQDQLRAGQLLKSAGLFRQLVQRYPKSKLLPYALQREGSARYAGKDYPGAIQALSRLASEFPQDPRRPDTLLTLSAAQAESGQTGSAEKTLQAILNSYPKSPSAQTARERLKILKGR